MSESKPVEKWGSGAKLAERQTSDLVGQRSNRRGSFQSPYPVIECPARLLDALSDGKSPSDMYGDVTLEGFELHRGTRVRAGSHPVLRGRFSPSDGGTHVEYRLGSSKSSQPYMRIAAVIWAIMAFSWVIFFVYWLVDPEGIDIGLPRLLILLAIVVLMGFTIAAGRRTDEDGGAELVDFVQSALTPDEGTVTFKRRSRGRLEEE